MIQIDDIATGEVIVREMNPEEYEQLAKDKITFKILKDKVINNAAVKQSAQAKLAALGLTADEVTAIIGD